MLIDTHAHLNFRAYDKDRDEVVKRCQSKPMKVINVGAQLETSKKAVELANHHDNLYATVGLHPLHVFDEIFSVKDYESLINDKVVAIGETGLDYWWFKHLQEPYKIVLLHGWGGSKEERFFIWLDKELTKLGHQVIRFNQPDTDNPNQAAWLKETGKQVGYVNAKTLLVGFSLGGATILRFLETLDEDARVGGVFLLGAPADPLGYVELADFFKTDFNWGQIKSVCPNFYIYSSDNDEVVPPAHGKILSEKLNAKLKVVKGAWHFNVEELPDVLSDIKNTISQSEKELPTIEEVIKKQKALFLDHVKLAKINQLPLMLHARNGPSTSPLRPRAQGREVGTGLEGKNVYLEMLEILKEEKVERAVFHCYGGDLATAKEITASGYFIGIDGPVTFTKKSEELQKIVREIPLEKILIETDCPYLAPEPHRGERNEPVYVEFVAQKIADLKGLSKEEVIERTWQNAKNLFKL